MRRRIEPLRESLLPLLLPLFLAGCGEGDASGWTTTVDTAGSGASRVAVAADGRIVVLDGQAQEVRIFGPDPPPVIRGHTLWGVVRDGLDVPAVVRGRLVEDRAIAERGGGEP